MRIKTFFVAALAVPTLAAMACGTWIVADLWQAYSGNGQARNETAALEALAQAVEVYAVQRGNINVSMLSDSPVSDAMRKSMEEERHATGQAVNKALTLMRGLRRGPGDVRCAVASSRRYGGPGQGSACEDADPEEGTHHQCDGRPPRVDRCDGHGSCLSAVVPPWHTTGPEQQRTDRR